MVKQSSGIFTILRITSFFLILILFEGVLFDFFKGSFLGKMLYSIKSPSIILDVLFLWSSFLIIVMAILKARIRYQLSIGYYTFLIALIFYYVSFRVYSQLRPGLQFEFISSHIFNILYYDMLFGSLAVGLILFYFINKYQEKVKKNIQSDPNLSDNGRFLLDNPIDNDKDDRYGYTILADQIVSAVLDPRQTSHSFTIGINGQWGIGKSSLLRLIKNRLDQKLLKSESDHILITFSPLLLNTANTLTIEFLHQLNAQLRKYSIQSNDQLRKYIYFLTNKINDLWSGLISIFSGDQSSQDQSKILAGIIMSINRQIIVTIDDLDRLEKEEIIEIFRLIRNIADLPYLTYIIAFDKEYLCKKLEEKEDIRKAESFIEKFFAVEVVLPKIKNELVREHFVEESRKRIPYFSQGIDQAFNIFENQDRMLGFVRDKIVPLNFFMASLNTRRDIIRFINSLILFPQELLIEVIPGEIIILELLKLKNAKVYNDLKKKAIVTLNYSKHVYFLEEQKLDDLLKDNYPVNSAYIKSAVKILFGTEFPTETNLDRKSIVNEDRYEIYFNYIDTSFLHYSELDALRKK